MSRMTEPGHAHAINNAVPHTLSLAASNLFHLAREETLIHERVTSTNSEQQPPQSRDDGTTYTLKMSRIGSSGKQFVPLTGAKNSLVHTQETAPLLDIQQIHQCFREVLRAADTATHENSPRELLEKTQHWRARLWQLHDTSSSSGRRLVAWRCAGDVLNTDAGLPCLPRLLQHQTRLDNMLVQLPKDSYGSATVARVLLLPQTVIDVVQPARQLSLRQMWQSAGNALHAEHILAFLAQLVAWFVQCQQRVHLVLHSLSLDDIFVARTTEDILWFAVPTHSDKPDGSLYNVPTFGIIPQWQALRDISFVWDGVSYTGPTAQALPSPIMAWRQALSQFAVSIRSIVRDTSIRAESGASANLLQQILQHWLHLTDWSSHEDEHTPVNTRDFLLEQMHMFQAAFVVDASRVTPGVLSSQPFYSL